MPLPQLTIHNIDPAIIDRFFNLNVYASILIVSVATAIYTVVGGLLAVVVTEALQTLLLLGGAVIVTVLALLALGENGIYTLAALEQAARPRPPVPQSPHIPPAVCHPVEAPGFTPREPHLRPTRPPSATQLKPRIHSGGASPSTYQLAQNPGRHTPASFAFRSVTPYRS